MTSNTTSKDNQAIRIRIISTRSNTRLTIRIIFPLLLILQFSTFFNVVRFLLAVLTEFLLGTFGLGAASTVIALAMIVVVAG